MAYINSGVHMSDFHTTVKTIEEKFDFIYDVTNEILNDINSCTQSINDASAGKPEEELEGLDEFKDEMAKTMLNECETLKTTLKSLTEVFHQGEIFREKESEIRKSLNENPDLFAQEKDITKAFQIKKTKETQEHHKYTKLIELLEKYQNEGGTGDDDLLMDEPSGNQVIKCPITSKPIQIACKNTNCDHVYEREAILAYIKGQRNKRCPFAGCKQFVVLSK